MRILHTSDWHLGARLRNQDRLNDHFERLQEICEHIDREEVDLLLVAGDVFDEYRSEALARIISLLARLLTPRIEDGLSCVFIAGNHDREHVFPLLRGLQDLISIESRARVIFTERPKFVQVTSRHNETLNLVLLPYPTPIRYSLAAERWPSPDKKNETLASAVRSEIQRLTEEAQTSGRGSPTVMCGHFLVRGVKEGLYQLTEQDDIPLERSDLPAYAYIALGHIHKPQTVGAPHIRYCGSLDRMDRAEVGYDKQAVLVDIGKEGLRNIRELPLHATPFAHIQASSGLELAEKAEQLLDRDRALVSLTLFLKQGQPLNTLQAQARQLFPRLYGPPEVRWMNEQTPTGVAPQLNDYNNVAGTVRNYLRSVLGDDPDVDALVQEAEKLLTDIEETT